MWEHSGCLVSAQSKMDMVISMVLLKLKKSSESTITKTKTKTKTNLHFLIKLILILKLFSLPKQHCFLLQTGESPGFFLPAMLKVQA